MNAEYDIGCESSHFARIQENISEDALSRLESAIRSSPAPQTDAPGPCPCPFEEGFCNYSKGMDIRKSCSYLNGQHDSAISAKAREEVLNEIRDHIDGRLEGLENLFATPKEQRCESAQGIYLKESYVELTLVKHLIDSLRQQQGGGQG